MRGETEQDDALKALESIEDMEKSALRRAMPPRWFNLVLSLLAGSLVALSVAGLRDYHVIVIVLMTSVLVYQAQSSGVALRGFPVKVLGKAIIILVPLFFLLIIAAQAYSENLGTIGAPLTAGLVLAAAVYLFSIHERRWFMTKTEGGE